MVSVDRSSLARNEVQTQRLSLGIVYEIAIVFCCFADEILGNLWFSKESYSKKLIISMNN